MLRLFTAAYVSLIGPIILLVPLVGCGDDHTGGKSNALAWTVTAAATTPTVTQVLPIPVPVLNSNQTLTINGSNFVSGATVTY